MAKVIFTCLIILISIAVGSALKCYNCDPSHAVTNCNNIGSNKPTEEDCADDETLCITLYLAQKFEDKLEGTYRNCYSKGQNTKEPCNVYREENSQLNITNCETCEGDLCNTNQLKSGVGNIAFDLLICIPITILYWNF